MRSGKFVALCIALSSRRAHFGENLVALSLLLGRWHFDERLVVVVQEREELVILALGNRVELVIVALAAIDGQAQPRFCPPRPSEFPPWLRCGTALARWPPSWFNMEFRKKPVAIR